MNLVKGRQFSASKPGKLVLLLVAVLFGTACTHPVEIVGDGDIVSSSGQFDCRKEQSPCNFEIVNEYRESYTAVARAGHRFSHWENCLTEAGNSCSWNINANMVKDHWGKTMPAMRAFFIADDSRPHLPLSQANAPFNINGLNARFFQNISYGTHDRNTFDIFLPNSGEPTGLIIYIHGGGFVSMDKTVAYDGRQAEIKEYLRKNIAFASINYRYMHRNPQGLLATLNDAKRALQFMRYHAGSLNIDKSRVALYGDSAGAGTAMWLAVHDDMADPKSNDPVLRETTRVRGAAALETQASYDFLLWEQKVFKQFGMKITDMAPNGSGLQRRVLEGLNLNNINEIYTEKAKPLRKALDMLGHYDAADPELFIANLAQSAAEPTNQSQLTHHPLHAMMIYRRAVEMEHPIIAYIPKLGVSHNRNIRHVDYLINKVQLAR